MIGRILNTLEHRLKKEEWEWRSTNVIRRDMAYSCSRGVLIRNTDGRGPSSLATFCFRHLADSFFWTLVFHGLLGA
jgi:hypothetical protein